MKQIFVDTNAWIALNSKRDNEELEDEAWGLFKQHIDREYSFTDCTSFVVMRRMKLTDAFTNDHHFTQMGFVTLLKP